MRIEFIERVYPSGKSTMTMVNLKTRRYIGQIAPYDSNFNCMRIKDATDLYQDLMDYGLLHRVLVTLQKHKVGMLPEQQK